MDIYLASNNQNKIKELQDLFKYHNLEATIYHPSKIGGMPEVNEIESTFKGNALLKAQALKSAAPANSLVIADDSGLEIHALNNAPGIHSARYAGPNATDLDNIQKALNELKGTSEESRSAHFTCCICLIDNKNQSQFFTGTCNGHITTGLSGTTGFGYDPLFIPDGYNQTFAQLGPDTKNKISHRSLALEQLITFLKLNNKTDQPNPINF